MVDQPERGTNQSYLTDFIAFVVSSKHLNIDKVRQLYASKHMSASQISEEVGLSKSVIVQTLKQAGITHGKSGRSTHHDNYRNCSPPYGYSVKNGKLVTNKSELRVCRLVVELRGRRGLSSTEVAAELGKRGHKNRAGRSIWNPTTVLKIFRRWNGKL